MSKLGGIFKSLFAGGKVDILARYEILREAVSGTMSQFYKARDRQTDQIIGLKVLDREKIRQFEARFRGLKKPTEGQIAVSIQHPRVVETLSHGITTKDEQFLVMEFLDGPGLNSMIIGQYQELSDHRLTLVRQAAEALSAVHEAGYIHRDVCPRNFVVNPRGTSLKLIDFGLTVPATKLFMQPGNRTGTPNYMSPEVVRRRPTDHRLDIYSFGASVYEMFTYELPWQRGVDGQAAMTHGTEKLPPLEKHCPHIDPRLARAVMRCLASNPKDRPPTMQAFLNLIRSVKKETVE